MKQRLQASQRYTYLQTLTLLLSMPLSGLAIDIYVPSLPTISQLFHVSAQLSQSSISFYIFGYAAIQFVAGNISDMIGRRIPYVSGIVLFVVSCTAITLISKNIYYLIFWRTLQGIAAGIIIVPVRAIFADLYSGEVYLKYANYATVAWAIGPIVAPLIGGYLHYFWGWQASFYFLGAYAIVLLGLFVVFVPETQPKQSKITLQLAILNYKLIIGNPEFAAGVILQGLLYAIFILFSIVSPFLIQQQLHYSVVSYGHLALVLGLCWFLGNLTNRLLTKVDLQIKVLWCLIIMLLICLVSCLINLQLKLNLSLIILTSASLLFFASIIYPNFFAKNTKLFPGLSGSASAIAGGGCFITSAIVGQLGQLLLTGDSSLPLFLGYLAIICALFFAYWLQLYFACRITPGVKKSTRPYLD